MTLSISTNDPTYKKYKTDVEVLLADLQAKFVYFQKMPLVEQKAWLAKDAVLDNLFKIAAVITKRYPDMVERYGYEV